MPRLKEQVPVHGPNLRYLRTVRRLTQQQLADRAGITQAYLSRLETETGKMAAYEVVKRLAAKIGTHPSLLLVYEVPTTVRVVAEMAE